MSNDNELNKVREGLQKWLDCLNNNNLDLFFSMFDPNIVYANAGTPLMRGLDQVRQWYKEATSVQGTTFFKEEVAFIEVNMAILIGKFIFKPSNKEVSAKTGRVALLYRKKEDGRWLLLFDMDQASPDCRVEDFS